MNDGSFIEVAREREDGGVFADLRVRGEVADRGLVGVEGSGFSSTGESMEDEKSRTCSGGGGDGTAYWGGGEDTAGDALGAGGGSGGVLAGAGGGT